MKNVIMEQQLLWEKLSGKRLVLCGNGKKRDGFVQNLTHMIEQNKADVVLLSDAEKVKDKDYVILFGESADEISVLGKELQCFMNRKPQSVVLISDYAVYGKCFGESRARKENELGYVSHTSKTEISIQNMRMAEHLVCRLAREEGMNIKIVRTDNRLDSDAEETLQKVLVSVLQVLLFGAAGEIYNLPVSSEYDCEKKSDVESAAAFVWDEKRSPLSAGGVIPDTKKYEDMK